MKDETKKSFVVNIPEGYEIDREKSSFEEIVFKPIIPSRPKTWLDFCKTHPIQKSEHFVGQYSKIYTVTDTEERNPTEDRRVLPSEDLANAMLALCQLIQLRDCYNEGWKPNWTEGSPKAKIIFDKDEMIAAQGTTVSSILVFKTKEIRDEFLNNFRFLIEIARPLL